MLTAGFRWEVLPHCNKTFFQFFCVPKDKNKFLGLGIKYNWAAISILVEEYIISQSVNPHTCKYLKAPGVEINLQKLIYKMNHVSWATPRPLPPTKKEKG